MGRMTAYLLGGVMFAVGALAAMQPPINAALAERTGPIHATAVSFAVGTALLVIISLAAGPDGFAGIRGAPWWQLSGGFIGAVLVFSTVLIVPRLGAAALIASLVAGQLTGGLVLDRLALFGLERIALTPVRLAGILLLAVGGYLVLRR